MYTIIWIFTVIITFCIMEFVAWFSHKYIMHGFLWFLHKDHHKKDHNSWFERNDMFFLQYAAISIFFTVLWGEYNFLVGATNSNWYFFVWFSIFYSARHLYSPKV